MRNTKSGSKKPSTISMRGVLRFKFPAHASLEVRKQVVSRFVRDAQALIDREEAMEHQLAAIRRGVSKAGLRTQRTCFTYPEAAEQLGITEAQLAWEVSIGMLLTGTVGYVKVIGESEIRRFKEERATAVSANAPARKAA